MRGINGLAWGNGDSLISVCGQAGRALCGAGGRAAESVEKFVARCDRGIHPLASGKESTGR